MAGPKQFYFAWVDEGTAFNPAVHNVEDEKIVDLNIEHVETEFATCTIDIKNPRVGLLASGRKLWAWIAVTFNNVDILPLFYGRLVGLPGNFIGGAVTLSFIARPVDFGAQKVALASTLREMPYYDPVFIKSDMYDDPDIVLEGRTELWHIDRVTHEVTTSDMLVGEDGTVEFEEGEVPAASVEVSLREPAARKIRVTASVPWTQNVSGQNLTVLKNWQVNTLAGQGVINGWPKPEGSLGGGWTVYSSRAESPYMNLTEADWANWYIAWQRSEKPEPPFAVSIIQSYSANVSGGESGRAESSATRFVIIQDRVSVDLAASYSAARKRKDIVTFELVTDAQSIVTEPEDDEVLELAINGNDVSLPIDPNADYPDIPIGNDNLRSYFTTERGMMSLQYLIQLARARAIYRSRAVEVKWQCTFLRAMELTMRKNALLNDRRLPGGQALGKIVGYSLRAGKGRAVGEVAIAACIGRGGSITEVEGTGVYAAPGYMNRGYQYHEGATVVLGAGDVGFTPLLENANDDGLVFPLRAVPMVINPHNVTVQTEELIPVQPTVTQSVQVDDCGNTTSISVSSNLDTGPYSTWLGGIETKVVFSMKAVSGGPFESTYPLTVTDLKLPKQIDLEAPAL